MHGTVPYTTNDNTIHEHMSICTHFCMLYCADKHKMACFVFTAYRCCMRALFLLSAALCCFAHTADLRQEEADDNQKQTRSTLQKTRPMRNMYVHHAATSWAWYHHATVASELRLRSFSINLLPFSVLLLWRQQHEGLHANKHKLSTGQRT